LGCESALDSLESGVLFLHAVDNATGEVVGYISATPVYEGATAALTLGDGWPLPPGPHTRIHHLAVLPHHRRRGIGRMLFQELLAHLGIASPSVAHDLRLSVAVENAEVLEWYRRLGFIDVDEVEAEFPNKCRARFRRMQRLDAG